MQRILRGILAAIIVVSGTAGIGSTVHAQQAADIESITLSPVSRKFQVQAGETVKDKMTVVNDGKIDYDFIVYSRPYSVTNEEYQPNFTQPKANADAYSWVKLDTTRFHLKAGETTVVEYSLQVPERAAPGGHYGVIFAETQPTAQQSEGNSVVRKKRVGTLLYATVNGKVINEGEVVSTTIPFWQQQPPLTATMRVKNTGNTDFTDDTVITVKDIFGNTKFQATKQHTVLPNTTRKIVLEWPGSSWFGLYNVEVSQKVLGETSRTSGYVLMLPRYIPLLAVGVLAIGGVYAWLRHRKK